MKIETKFNINDTVYYMYNNLVNSSIVKHINISISNVIIITYDLDICNRIGPQSHFENKLFRSKEELFASL